MRKRILASRLMIAGGIIELLVAVAHFFMPLELGRNQVVHSLPAEYQSFLSLGIIAIGLCQAIFGFLSIHFSRGLLVGRRSAWVYGISQGIGWTARSILEWVFPVEIPLLSLSNPSTLFIPLLPVIALLFLVPMLAFRRELIAQTPRFDDFKPMPKLQ